MTTGPITSTDDVNAVVGIDRVRRIWRLRLAVASLGLVVLAFLQQPGLVVPDTKLDLTVDPVGFLGRALHLWEPTGAFGQVQNQAYGYLFPLGPLFAVGDWLHVPDWAIQRAWWGLILVTAFLGVVKLTGVLGVGTPVTRIIGGLAFAVTPRIVATVGAVSIEAWPTAVSPWIMVPVVLAWRGGSAWRCAAWSAAAVACVGGVNAAATMAAVLPAAIWVLAAPRFRRRLRFIAWWGGFTVVATAWWWVPVLVLGRYATPFLGWIESAAVTTALTSPAEALRGSSHWLSYLSTGDGPEWPAGWLLVSTPMLIVNTMLVAALGLAGLARRDIVRRDPAARRALLIVLVAGLGVVTAGYAGAGSGPFAGPLQDLLDGPLAALRNVHKFDPLIRLPLVVGLVHLLSVVRLPAMTRRHARAIMTAVAAVAVMGAATPAIAGRIPPDGATLGIPEYWEDTAAWLDDNVRTGRALLVPGASFGEYIWGTTKDEPLQPLTDARWAVRNAIPMAPAGTIRLLDGIDARLSSGRGGAGMVAALERAGVTHIVVRNDLDRRATGSPRPVLVHQGIADMPGVERVAAFGPDLGRGDGVDATYDRGLDVVYPAVEVFALPGADVEEHRIDVRPLTGTVRMSGAAESLLTVGDAGLLDERAVFVGGDGADIEDPAPLAVITDGNRRRARSFGAVRDDATEVLQADDHGPMDRAVRDFVDASDDPERQTTAVVRGVRDVTASSSGADPAASLARGTENSPWAAFDGDPRTSWLSGVFGSAVGQWIEVRFDGPRDVAGAEVVMHTAWPVAARATEVSVTTAAGSTSMELQPGETAQSLATPAGPTDWMRVTVTRTGVGPTTGVGIRELSIPGVTVERRLLAPAVTHRDVAGRTSPERIVFTAADGYRDGCVEVGADLRCVPSLARAGEDSAGLARSVDLVVGGTYEVTGRVMPRPGDAIESLLAIDGGAVVTASSREIREPIGRPQAVFDGDLGTGWRADPDDDAPTLSFTLPQRRRITGIAVETDSSLVASRPETVTVRAGGDEFTLDLDDNGEARLPRPIRTSELSVEITSDTGLLDIDPGFGVQTRVPPGVSELRLTGAEDLAVALPESAETMLPCGFGPPLVVDGTIIPTVATGTVRDVLRGGTLDVRPCDANPAVTLRTGHNEITLEGDDATIPLGLTLTPVDAREAGVGDVPKAQVGAWGPDRRTVSVQARERPVLLQVTENVNDGWVATIDDEELVSVRADGWAQGYVVPAGPTAEVVLTYRPDATYRAALAAGLAGMMLVFAMAVAGAVRRPQVGAAVAELDMARDAVGSKGRRQAERTRDASCVAAAVVGFWLLGGTTGLAAAGVGLAVLAARRVWPAVDPFVPGVTAVAAAVAGVAVAAAPWPSSAPGATSAAAQTAALAALAVVVIGSARPGEAPRRGGAPDPGS